MITANLLDEDQFLACFSEPMKDVTAEAEALVDIWPYVDALDLCAFGIHAIRDMAYVYRGANEAYEQILIETDKFNAMLVIVLDVRKRSIVGHHILDLNEKYGLT